MPWRPWKVAESGKSLYKMDAPKADTQSGTFRDVVGTRTKKAIEALAEKGVINGMTADTFAPDAGLTRAQFCAIVVRALGLRRRKRRSLRTFCRRTGSAAVGAASKAGIVNGVGNGKFNPQGAITREQAATMLARASKNAGAFRRGQGCGFGAESVSGCTGGIKLRKRCAGILRRACDF